MGIRGHVRVREPKYGDCVISSYISHALYRYLELKGVEVIGEMDGYTWEIEVTGSLRSEVERLARGDSVASYELDSLLPTVLVGKGICREVGAFLKEGIDAAERNGYTFITIEWF